MRWIVLACIALLLNGCGYFRSTVVPMPVLRQPAVCTSQPSTLIVLLPGRGALPTEFLEHGFISQARQQGINADIWIADAHMGYYRNRSIIDRLQADVIKPAQAAGYQHIWLMGISLGGFGSLLYSSQHAGDVAGIVAIAPYLGEAEVSDDIAAAGGLGQWQAPADASTMNDGQRLWQWLQGYAKQPVAAGHPDLWLAWGTDDRFAKPIALLANALPAEHLFTADGGHEWKTWQALWPRVLRALPLPKQKGCGDRALPLNG